MGNELTLPRSELILGGQRSGKSARAERLAAQWLAASASHSAVLLATAQPHDEEMRQRIAWHRADRVARVPGMRTVEEPLDIASAITLHSTPHTLLVVDCLTLWLTNWLMPSATFSAAPDSQPNRSIANEYKAQAAMVFEAIAHAKGPVVIVSNEIGLGVIPLGAQVRAYVDALGRLNQDTAQVCERVTLMAAGLPLTLKGAA